MELILTFLGVQIPALALIFLICGIFQILLNRVMSDLGVYDYVWHPGLFRIALFFCMFCAASLFIYH